MKKTLACLLAAMTAFFAVPVSAEEEPRLLRVACVGDSLTQGTCCSDEATCSYPAELQALLDQSRYEVKNFGASGFAAMKKYNKGWSYWDHANFKKSHDYLPDIVILMLGTNDIIHNRFDTDYEADMKELIGTYQSLDSHPTVYVVTAPVAHDSRGDNLQNKVLPAQKKIAEETGCTLIDLNTETLSWAKNELYAPDGLHFNDKGYLKMAGFFCETIFKEPLRTLTVKGDGNYTVSLAGQQGNPSQGDLTFVTGNGKKTLALQSADGSATFPLEVKGDTTLTLAGELMTGLTPNITYAEDEAVSSAEEPTETKPSKLPILLSAAVFAVLIAAAAVILFIITKRRK